MSTPNFTIITPGGCNSKCSFCTDPMNRPASKDYIKNMLYAFEHMPPEYRQVSISGGEPTISPEFMNILHHIKNSGRFDKVVLTTNGTKLAKYADQLGGLVHHINLSRHAIGYEDNVKIFGTKAIPKDEDIPAIVKTLNDQGIDVNFNQVYCESDADVINESTNKYVSRYVDYVKSLGGSSITYRYDQNPNNLSTTYLELDLYQQGYQSFNHGEWGFGRSHDHIINDMLVMMKASLAEPKLVLGAKIYELVYHIDGRLCADWEGELEYDIKHHWINQPKTPEKPAILSQAYYDSLRAIPVQFIK